MNPRNRKSLLLIAAGICLLLLVGDKFLVSPLARNWRDRETRIDQLKRLIANGDLLLKRRRTLEDRWAAARQAALPTDSARAENILLSALADWGNDAGMNLTSIRPRWIDDETLGPRLEIRLSGDGGIESIGRFMHALETADLSLRLESVQLRANDDRGRTLSFEARMSGLTPAGGEESS